MATQDKYARLKSDTVLAPLGQALVNLSRANTEQLLSDASQLMRSRRTEAAAILNRLKEMNAIVATQFRPKQDALSLLNLRMICSQLPPSDNFSLPSFIVVSYCWHYPQWPLSRAAKPIAPGWDISRPMIDAVMGVRENDSEGVWLDKLCINQADPVDKEVHIGAMDMIYRSARRVVILLEDVQLNKDEEAAGLAYAAFYADLNRIVKERDLRGKEKSEFIDKWFPSQEKEYHDSGRGHELAAIKSFAMNILEARWYSRAWCAHESRVAPHKKVNNPLFLCFGHDGRVLSFEFRFVFYMSIYLQDKETPLDDEDLVGNGLQMTLNDPEPKTLYQLRMRIQRLHAVYEPDTSALQHLVNILSFGCFLKGDLMSIALNTSGIPLCFDGKLDAPDDIIWIFSLLVLAAGDLVPLIEGAFKVRIPDATAPNGMVISWAPRLTQGTLVNRLPEMSPGTITAAAREYIELDLLVFTSLPCTASPESMTEASRVVEEYRLEALAQEFAAAADEGVQRNRRIIRFGMAKVSGSLGPMAVFHRLWLAHALDCGMDWILRFADVMRNETTDEGEFDWSHGPLGVRSDAKLTDAARAVLSHFKITVSDKEDDKQYEDYLAETVRFLTCILDPRLPLLTVAPRRLPAGPGDFAFVPSTSNRSWIVVPAAIAHLPAYHNRSWIVEPFDPAAEPEKPEDHLPDPNTVLKPGDMAVDVYPLLTSDYDDRRAPRNDERGSWRLRRRDHIFGCQPWKAPINPADFPNTDDGAVVYMKKQRVYGAEDYDWKSIHAAIRKIEDAAKLGEVI